MSPITIRKNDDLLFEAKNIQEAAKFLSEHLKITKSKCFDYIERGYVYHITYDIKGDEYSFIAPAEIALNRRKELEERGHHNARRVWLIPANPEEFDVVGAFSEYEVLDWRRSVILKMAISYLYMSLRVFTKYALKLRL
ncbi:hypothetical protein [Gottfriedia sp. OAE603]|uniref:hypothetical protein n=1 Tax=Gottfriedia sp. OAE603 TaxID=2663872 RepID=UPI001A07F5DB